MARGGPRPGAGRKPGAANKATQERQKAIEESGLTPLDYMLGILRDETMATESRFEAAKAAAPYVHPKLANMTLQGDEQKPMVHKVVREIVRT